MNDPAAVFHPCAFSTVVFNVGHHFGVHELSSVWNGEAAQKELAMLGQAVSARRLKLIFQRHEEQHFEGGAYNATRHLGRPEGSICVPPSKGTASSIARWEETVVLPQVRALGGSVLETHDMNRRGWWSHSYAGPTASRTADCTHWCLPGMPDVWASMLFERLLAVS